MSFRDSRTLLLRIRAHTQATVLLCQELSNYCQATVMFLPRRNGRIQVSGGGNH